MNTRPITGIIIHCSGTPNGEWHNVEEIDQWHQTLGHERLEEFRARFNPHLLAIGYHFIIYPNGAIATGRHLDEVGQHTTSHNTKTIAICLIGTDKFTRSQWESLRANIYLLISQKRYPNARIVGCCQIELGQRDNPGFHVPDWLENGMVSLPRHILEPQS